MNNYFDLVNQELLNKLQQIKCFVKNHNPTIGILTEEILRDFLTNYIPKSAEVKQGFIINKQGELSKQCDIIIFDNINFSPIYKIKDLVIVPSESVIAVIEVKTSVTKSKFEEIIKYFENISKFTECKKYLFIYNSVDADKIIEYLKKHGPYDEISFQSLPDYITGLDESYHLQKNIYYRYVQNLNPSQKDSSKKQLGYHLMRLSRNLESGELHMLELFYKSIKSLVAQYSSTTKTEISKNSKINNMEINPIISIEHKALNYINNCGSCLAYAQTDLRDSNGFRP